MIRSALGILAACSIVVAIAGSCSPPAPKPMDVSSYPSAKTSAEPLFITNARPDASAAPAVSAAPSASASASATGLAADPWK